jgi:hypothetical protein
VRIAEKSKHEHGDMNARVHAAVYMAFICEASGA